MALLTCTECGSQVSDRASACPKCGCPVGNIASDSPLPEQETPAQHQPRYTSFVLFAVLGSVVALVVAGSWYSSMRAEEQRVAESRRVEDQRVAIEAESKRLAAQAEVDRLERIATEKQHITANPDTVLEPSDFRIYDRGILNSYRQLTQVSVLNKSRYALRSISGRVEWLTVSGDFVGASPFGFSGSIPAGDTKRFTIQDGTLETGTIQGSAERVRLVFTTAEIVE